MTMRLAGLIDSYINTLKTQKGYSEHTVRNYRSDLEQFLGFLRTKRAEEGKAEQEPAVESIDFLVIREYFGNLFSGAKRTTVARKMSTSSRPLSLLLARAIMTPSVVVLMPPPVEPGEAPTNMRSIVNSRVAPVAFP